MGSDHDDPTDAPAPPRAFRPVRPRAEDSAPPEAAVRRAIEALLPNSHVLRTLFVERRPAFRATWQAHRDQAVADGQMALLGTATVLLDAADRVPSRRLLAAEVAWKGRGYAVFVDAQREAVLAVLHDPANWLSGVQ